MQRLRDKLRDERGVSILMALFALLVVAMVCIVILTAANSTVRQGDQDRTVQQNLLVLQSAGELVEGCVAEHSCSYRKTEVSRADESGDLVAEQPSYSTVKIANGEPCILGTEVETVVQQVLVAQRSDSGAAPYKSSTLEFTVNAIYTDDSGEEHSQPASASVWAVAQSGSGPCQLVFSFKIMDGESVLQETYMSMVAKATYESQSSSDYDTETGLLKSVTTITTTTFTWGSPSYYRLKSELQEKGLVS